MCGDQVVRLEEAVGPTRGRWARLGLREVRVPVTLRGLLKLPSPGLKEHRRNCSGECYRTPDRRRDDTHRVSWSSPGQSGILPIVASKQSRCLGQLLL